MTKSKILFLLCVFTAIGLSCNTAKDTDDYYLFIGTYTGESSEGIYLYKFDASTGQYDSLGAATGVSNPSYLTISDDYKNVYAVNEEADSSKASVSAFSFDRETAKLSFLNKRSSLGGAPCYVSTDSKGSAVFVGNYVGGSLTMFPILDDGSLAEPKINIAHEGSSANKSRQNSSHVHCTYISPDNKHLLVSDLGTDKVYGYAYNSKEVTLSSEPDFVYNAQPGAGARHLTYHPKRDFAYLVNELNGTVVAFSAKGDSLQALQTVSTLPDNYKGPKTAADIHVSPDGRYLYATNRENLNSIVAYAIDQQQGTLTQKGTYSTGGVHPRNFAIDPTGNYLLVANRKTDNIAIFKRNTEDGSLTPSGNEIMISQPVCLKVIPVES